MDSPKSDWSHSRMPGTPNNNIHTAAWIHFDEKDGFTGFILQIYKACNLGKGPIIRKEA